MTRAWSALVARLMRHKHIIFYDANQAHAAHAIPRSHVQTESYLLRTGRDFPLTGECLPAPARPELPSPRAAWRLARTTRPLFGRFRSAIAAPSRPSARLAAAADGAARTDAAFGQDACTGCANRRLRVSRTHASLAVSSAVSRRRSEGVGTHPR